MLCAGPSGPGVEGVLLAGVVAVGAPGFRASRREAVAARSASTVPRRQGARSEFSSGASGTNCEWRACRGWRRLGGRNSTASRTGSSAPCDFIAAEALKITNKLRRVPGTRGLNRAIAEQGRREFLDIPEGKAESAGIPFVEVPPAGTSQDCSRCGTKVPKALSERITRAACTASNWTATRTRPGTCCVAACASSHEPRPASYPQVLSGRSL